MFWWVAGATARADLTISQAESLPHEEVEAQLGTAPPAVILHYAARLYAEGRRDEAVFWHEVGFYHPANHKDDPWALQFCATVRDYAMERGILKENISHAKAWLADPPKPKTPPSSSGKSAEHHSSGLKPTPEPKVTQATPSRNQKAKKVAREEPTPNPVKPGHVDEKRISRTIVRFTNNSTTDTMTLNYFGNYRFSDGMVIKNHPWYVEIPPGESVDDGMAFAEENLGPSIISVTAVRVKPTK
jgi:hypothetical protein